MSAISGGSPLVRPVRMTDSLPVPVIVSPTVVPLFPGQPQQESSMTSPSPHATESEHPAPLRLLRSYPRNSAEAAARLVALALIANGRIKAVETAALEALRSHERLRLTRPQWHGVIQDLCADLLGPARCGDEICISDDLLDRMLDEVGDERKRRTVLHICSAVVHADCQVDDGESFVLLAMIERCGLHPDDHALLEPMLYGADFQVRPRGVAARARKSAPLR